MTKMALSEKAHAIRLANTILNRPSGDPDDDLAVLSRQLLRAIDAAPDLNTGQGESVKRLRALINAGDDACIGNTPMIPLHRDTVVAIEAAIRRLEAERDAYRTQAINRGWNWPLCVAYGRVEYERHLTHEVDETHRNMLAKIDTAVAPEPIYDI